MTLDVGHDLHYRCVHSQDPVTEEQLLHNRQSQVSMFSRTRIKDVCAPWLERLLALPTIFEDCCACKSGPAAW